VGSFKLTYQAEGIRGLYRGFGVTLAVVPTFWAIYFVAYNDFKRRISQSEWDELRQARLWGQHIMAACAAGAVADVLVNPLFVARVRLQTQHMQLVKNKFGPHCPTAETPPGAPSTCTPPKKLYTSSWNTLTRMVREEGTMSLFRGISASLLGLTHVMVQFPLYEWLKVEIPQATHSWLHMHPEEEGPHQAEPAQKPSQSQECRHPSSDSARVSSLDRSFFPSPPSPPLQPTMSELICASAISKMIASVVSYPHEVLRARMQNAHMSAFSSLRDCAIKTVKHEGWRALYQGLGGQRE
jgi:solute carrier family 25 folate transporter 32